MSIKTLRIAAAAATLSLAGAFAVQAASDDQMKYRDGKPVAGQSMSGDHAMSMSSHKGMKAKPMRHGSKKMSGKHHTKKHAMKRSHSAKRLRGHGENPSSRM